MAPLRSTLVRLFGAVAALIGAAGLLFIAIALREGRAEIFATFGSTLLLFLFSLALLAFLAGSQLLVRPVIDPPRSLVPRWALVVCGSSLILSILFLMFFGGGKSWSGAVLLGALGAYWLRQGIRVPPNKSLERGREG